MRNKYSHLWNDLPYEERNRLVPHMLEAQILHLEQARATLVRGHKETLQRLDQQIYNLERELSRRESEEGRSDG